uniref:Uncharacterized protein n=1 Tax=Oryza brachyantha TaxID=4533 RepID=J3L328_ORYBR
MGRRPSGDGWVAERRVSTGYPAGTGSSVGHGFGYNTLSANQFEYRVAAEEEGDVVMGAGLLQTLIVSGEGEVVPDSRAVAVGERIGVREHDVRCECVEDRRKIGSKHGR